MELGIEGHFKRGVHIGLNGHHTPMFGECVRLIQRQSGKKSKVLDNLVTRVKGSGCPEVVLRGESQATSFPTIEL